MTDQWPRTLAIFSAALGLAGAWFSRIFLTTPFTAFLFILGASVWVFFIFRSFSPKSGPLFIAAWTWSIVLHLSILPLSGVIRKAFQTELPIPLMIGTMLSLSICGLLSELAYHSHLKKEGHLS